MTMNNRVWMISLAMACRAIAAHEDWCGASEKAAADLQDRASFDAAIERLRALRDERPRDLFVHLRYQDAVIVYGPATVRRAMPHEYEQLLLQHQGDPFYQYLHGRALQGLATRLAIEGMSRVLALRADFAPAYRTLAEIYGSPAFHDAAKEKVNREKFAKLCPRVEIAARPGPIPGPSNLLAEAQRQFERKEKLDETAALIDRFVKYEEWRGERVGAFDWYTAEDRIKTAAEVQDDLFHAWRLLILVDRRSGKSEEAARMVRQMEMQLPPLKLARPSAYWTAAGMLAELYMSGGEPRKARSMVLEMEAFLVGSPDRRRAVELAKLKKRIAEPRT